MKKSQPSAPFIFGTALLVILVAGGYEYSLHPSSLSSSTQSPTPQENMTVFQVKPLGVEFAYPSQWKPFTFTRTDQTDKGRKGFEYSNGAIATSSQTSNQLFIIAFSNDIPGTVDSSILKTPIDPNWTTAQIEENKYFPASVIYKKKLSDKAVFVVNYDSVECSPGITMEVIAPFTDTVPNLYIEIPIPTLTPSEQALLDAADKQEAAKNGLSCDEREPYTSIVNGWVANDFSAEIRSELRTAQAIADSIKKIP